MCHWRPRQSSSTLSHFQLRYTVMKADRKNKELFGTWCWRRALQTAWTTGKINTQVLEPVKPKTLLETKMTKLQLTYFGHSMRQQSSLEETKIQKKIEGSSKCGRPNMKWICFIKEDTGMIL